MRVKIAARLAVKNIMLAPLLVFYTLANWLYDVSFLISVISKSDS